MGVGAGGGVGVWCGGWYRVSDSGSVLSIGNRCTEFYIHQF